MCGMIEAILLFPALQFRVGCEALKPFSISDPPVKQALSVSCVHETQEGNMAVAKSLAKQVVRIRGQTVCSSWL
jgi:hypothetical protein